MINNQINRQKQKKIDKHFDIVANGKKAKIINYKLSDHIDEYTGEKSQNIEIITKISNKVFESKSIESVICKDNKELTFNGNWFSTFSHAGLSKYHYKVESLTLKDEPSVSCPEE